jgi:hydroxymethylpyrimidine/phosphomethylpyrimidine kinase
MDKLLLDTINIFPPFLLAGFLLAFRRMGIKKVLLTVAGFDPTSGAGVSLDLKVFSRYGYRGTAVVTSLTVQNTQGVKKIHCPSSRFIWDQYKQLQKDVDFSGIKVGMLGSKDNIQTVGRILSDNPEAPRIIDTVFKSSSGSWLLEKKSIPVYMHKIKGKASLLTPNLMEAEWISGLRIQNKKEMLRAAEKIYALTQIPCLIKGGHLEGENVDILFDGKKFNHFQSQKLKKSVHGTGCFLSSAILCFLASGLPLDRAISSAKKATREAMKKTIRIGKGQEIFSI